VIDTLKQGECLKREMAIILMKIFVINALQKEKD
jgi:hypothetical protein